MKRLLLSVLLALPVPALAFEATDCLVLPSKEIEVGATVPGLLADVMFDRGDRVKAGEIVATLRAEVQEALLALARARAASPASLSAAEVRLAFAEQELKRADDLLRRRVISQQQADERRTAFEIRKREYEEAATDAELARLDVVRAEAELEVRRIRSPIDGVIIARSRDPGEYLRDDGSVVTVARLDPLHVEVFLPQERYGQVAAGDVVLVSTELDRDARREAVVEVVDLVMDASSATFGVRLSMPNPDLAVVGGIRCTADFGSDPAN